MTNAFRFLTAGESHGEPLTAVIDGILAGLSPTAEDFDADLARRQRGYGRGGRMKIEHDPNNHHVDGLKKLVGAG
jgi:chorismate synthase